ncbi:MAG TPA: FAD-dependent oxidoreductase [Burkholderiales bacterium]|nr:FAD-dependent oxidoreductase [Burkholderiales bacterium]
MSASDYDLIVVGEGIAGLACAARAAAAGLRVATFEAEFFGGLVTNVNDLEDFPEAEGRSGMELAAGYKKANAKAGVASFQAQVTGVDAAGDGIAVLADEATYRARALVVASGARLKRLGVPGEAELQGRGVSQCADCDGPLFGGKDVVVAGGGDSAAQEALVLAGLCRTVTIVHREAALRARPHFAVRLAAASNVTLLGNAAVEAIRGRDGVEAVVVRDLADGGLRELACAGVFPYVGLEPNADFIPPTVPRDAAGFLLVDASLETKLTSVWAIGQARAGFGGLLRDATEDAARVVQQIRERLG